jgi:ATP-binding cassette subfamily B protein/subfamily B ATP-binding cassette protein MsbA
MLPIFSSIVSLGLMFTIMWKLDPGMTLLALAVAPMMVWTLHRYSGQMMQSNYEQQDLEGGLYNTVEQTLSGINVVQAFGREEAADRRYRASADGALAATMKAAGVQLRYKVQSGFAVAIGTAGVLWISGERAISGHLTTGTIIVFMSYLASLYGPLEALMFTSATIHSAAGSGRRVLEILEADPEVEDHPGAPRLGPAQGHLQFKGVTFGYEPNRPVLRDLSLEIRPGECVAIVGPTGAGKSTLAGLVLRFFDPWAGSVSIDGQDLRAVALRSVRDQVSLVLQESFLFPVSIADNIAYGRPRASRGQVVAAAAAAGVDTFIRALPDGYDTVIGERGATLSGGERQRIAIARALLKDAPILILDEPTSALDAATEADIVAGLERLMAGRTTLIIAHRLSTVRRADRIAVLREGTVVEVGTERALMRHRGHYQRLHNLQFGFLPRPKARPVPQRNGSKPKERRSPSRSR